MVGEESVSESEVVELPRPESPHWIEEDDGNDFETGSATVSVLKRPRLGDDEVGEERVPAFPHEDDDDDNVNLHLVSSQLIAWRKTVEGCPICFEPWTSGGLHRVCSLRCGHLFGRHCIETWLNNGARSKCPQCNMPASKKDIRVLFVRKLSVVDTSERDALAKQLEEERFAKKMLMSSENKLRLAYNLAVAELNTVKDKLARLQASLGGTHNAFSLNSLTFLRSSTFDPATQCRLLECDRHLQIFVVGAVRKMGATRSHGIAKISLLDPDRIDHVNNLHEQVIKSIACSPHGDGMLLSTSFDRRLKLTSISSNSTVLSYSLEANGWSCCFDPVDRNLFYAGLANGSICIFDVRNTAGAMRVLSAAAASSLPIHSLSVLEGKDGGRMLSCATIQGPLVVEVDPSGEASAVRTIRVPSRGSCSSFLCAPSHQAWMASVRGAKTDYSLGSWGDAWSPQRTWSCDAPQASMTRPSILSHEEHIVTLCPNGPSALISSFGENFELREERLLHTNGAWCISDALLAHVDNKVLAGLLTERQFSLFSL